MSLTRKQILMISMIMAFWFLLYMYVLVLANRKTLIYGYAIDVVQQRHHLAGAPTVTQLIVNPYQTSSRATRVLKVNSKLQH